MSEIVPEPGGEDADWAVVAEAAGIEHAQLLVSSLRAADIPAWVERESAGAAIGITVGKLGRVSVLVPLEYEEQALALLGAREEGEIDEEEYKRYGLDEDENVIYLGEEDEDA